MYLKSIEVQGFKSFANKLVLEFHDGITGIVGPNGSGKSNVADAVRWVLGEQSAKQLRGAKMEDVIFSGTETRRPLGFAYVAITLDNSDHKLPIAYEEVTVARRVYRSGESEYLINGSACRLRDVQELFLDTGIGKEGYSIIGQGQIDKILSGKPEDRRELFDEAAGITKFKKRKALAEKNLDAERLNLSRISDILTEIEKQLGPLERQSAVAREYLQLKEELKGYEIASFIEEYEQSQTERKQTEEHLQIASAQMEETSRQYEGIRVEYERLEQELEEKNQELEACGAAVADTRIQKEKLEGGIEVLKEQILAARQSDRHYQERMEAVSKQLANRRKEYDGLAEQEEAVRKSLEEAAASQEEAVSRADEIQRQAQKLTEQTEAASQRLYDLGTRNTEARANLESQEHALEQEGIKRTALNQRILKNRSEETMWEDARKSHQKQAEELEEQTTALRRQIEEVKKETGQLSAQEKELEAEASGARQEYLKEQSRLDSLKNLAERYEGYGTSIRRILERKEQMPGIIGTVADIIQVKKDYETAIETALGASIQNIVTDTEETAKSLIAYLKKNQYGRATFLPLTAMDARRSQIRSMAGSEALKEPGVLGIASELVQTKERFYGLTAHLLGRTIVVDQIDHAIALAKKYQYSLRIVTLEGEQLNPGGSLSGGAYRNSSNLLGRKRELEELQIRVATLEKAYQKFQKQRALKQTERETKEQAAKECQEELQTLLLQENTLRLELRQDQEHLEAVQADYAEIILEGKALDGQLQEQKANIQSLRQELSRRTQEEKALRQELEESRSRSAKLSGQNQEWNETLSALRMQAASQEQSLQYIQEGKQRVKAEMEQLNQELAGLEESRIGSVKAVEEKEAQILTQQRQIAEAEQSIQETEQHREQLNRVRQRMSESHKSFFARREDLSGQISGLDKEIFRLNARKDKLSEQLDSLVHYMREEYDLTYSEAKASLQVSGVPESSPSGSASRKRLIGEVKAKIRALGDVNVNALEDYRSLNERYTLLHTQREDVLRAEEVLVGVIEELDTEMRRQFQEKFGEIQGQFNTVFRELFGGGKGTLELMEDADILEAGIRIIAQPPGKKLQNMMQLSGGEKALTAISLLFAIQNLKPSPFCLLDEIEAALDDSNVVRFARYLHKLTKHTQFIVITHRRGTMNAADILYGITMQEKGVSTLVSVSLIEGELNG